MCTPSSDVISGRSKVVLLLWIIFVFMSVPFSLVMACWERADLLALLYVMFPCVFITFLLVSRVRCSTWLY